MTALTLLNNLSWFIFSAFLKSSLQLSQLHTRRSFSKQTSKHKFFRIFHHLMINKKKKVVDALIITSPLSLEKSKLS